MGRDTADAMAAAGIAEETQCAHDFAIRILDPQVACLRAGITCVDIGIDAVLLDDEHRLPDGENSEQRARRQLVETSGMDLWKFRLGQLVACGSTAAVQNEQRFAAFGMMLRHSGHARVFDLPGSVGLASCFCMRLYGTTKKK